MVGLLGVHKMFIERKDFADFGLDLWRVRIERLSWEQLNLLLSSLLPTSSDMTNE